MYVESLSHGGNFLGHHSGNCDDLKRLFEPPAKLQIQWVAITLGHILSIENTCCFTLQRSYPLYQRNSPKKTALATLGRRLFTFAPAAGTENRITGKARSREAAMAQ